MRVAAGFARAQFRDNIAKYVRANHIQTDANFKRCQPAPARGKGTPRHADMTRVAGTGKRPR